MVEFALVAPVFFLLLFSIIELGIVFGTQNGLVTGLTFDVDELLRIGLSRVTRTLTDQECRTYLHLDTCP